MQLVCAYFFDIISRYYAEFPIQTIEALEISHSISSNEDVVRIFIFKLCILNFLIYIFSQLFVFQLAIGLPDLNATKF